MTSGTRAFAVSVAAVALLGAACSGGGGALSHADYQARLLVVRAQFQAAGKALGSGNLSSFTDLAAAIRQGEAGARKAADELAGLGPPADATDANALLVKGFREVADELDRVAKAADAHDAAALRRFEGEFSQGTALGVSDVRKARSELLAAGYHLPEVGVG